jgi:hypothetical protein
VSSYLRSVVTWDERQTHRECVRRVSNSSRTLYGEYVVAMEKAQWGEGGGAGGSKGHSV